MFTILLITHFELNERMACEKCVSNLWRNNQQQQQNLNFSFIFA